MDKLNILSLGWRSHWLAKRLKSLGVEVSLFEVTEQAGWSHPEDIDGPFPFPITLHAPEEFTNLAQVNESVEPLKTGFCLSTNDGNLAWDSLNRESGLNHLEKAFRNKAPEAKNFWFDDFLKSFAKSTYKKASNWESDEESFNLKSELYVRRSDRMTYSKSLELLQERGVEVQSVSTQDLRRILLEVKENSKSWIMGLTISELKILTAEKKESFDGELGWHRKRFFYESKNLESLPLWSCWVSSPFKPWKEDNLAVVIKGRQDNYLDVWTLEDVYSPDIKESSILKAHDFLKREFKYVDFAPQESENLEGSLKTFFPVENSKEVLNDTNYIWNSPMEWKGYSAELMYKYQYNLAQKIYDKGEEK